jgi:hypothetical protein
LHVLLASDPVMLFIGQTDEEVPSHSLWSCQRPNHSPLLSLHAPRLHASLHWVWSTVFVPTECLRAAPCPLWIYIRPSRWTQHLLGTSLTRCTRISPCTTVHTRNCATGLAVWPHFQHATLLWYKRRSECWRLRGFGLLSLPAAPSPSIQLLALTPLEC